MAFLRSLTDPDGERRAQTTVSAALGWARTVDPYGFDLAFTEISSEQWIELADSLLAATAGHPHSDFLSSRDAYAKALDEYAQIALRAERLLLRSPGGETHARTARSLVAVFLHGHRDGCWDTRLCHDNARPRPGRLPGDDPHPMNLPGSRFYANSEHWSAMLDPESFRFREWFSNKRCVRGL